jgi:hypothetical protein
MKPFSLTFHNQNIRRLHVIVYKFDIHFGSETLFQRKDNRRIKTAHVSRF